MTHNVDDDGVGVNFLAADEIRWTSEPLPRLERRDLLTLTDEGLRCYCRELQQETTWLRATLHEALAHVHRLTRQVQRYHVRIDGLITELRALRRGRRDEASR